MLQQIESIKIRKIRKTIVFFQERIANKNKDIPLKTRQINVAGMAASSAPGLDAAKKHKYDKRKKMEPKTPPTRHKIDLKFIIFLSVPKTLLIYYILTIFKLQ